jgi:hypothetical protein
MTRDGMLDDMKRSREDLSELGMDPGVWFRLPGGGGDDDETILKVVEEGGFRHVGWSMICGDWEGWTEERIAEAILHDVERRQDEGVSVPVVHSWPDSTPGGLVLVIDALDGKVSFLRLDALVEIDVPWAVLR